MKRRHMLFAPLALALPAPLMAADPPWSARLLKGGFDGSQWWSGFEIALASHWKTYWRVPGDGGIAPSLAFTGSNLQSSHIGFPFPSRIVTANGTTIGYTDRVVFPVAVVPADLSKPVDVSLKAFFGVCDEVCIPAPFEARVQFDPGEASAPDQMLISAWQQKVPKLTKEGPVTKAAVTQTGDTITLSLSLAQPASDLFVEGNAMHYFGTPVISPSSVVMDVSGAKSLDEVRATPLRVSLRTATKLLEQTVTVV